MWAYAAGKEKSFRNPALPGGVHQGIPATTPYLAGEKKGGVSEITHHIYGWEKGTRRGLQQPRPTQVRKRLEFHELRPIQEGKRR